jgi:hypothetical protein
MKRHLLLCSVGAASLALAPLAYGQSLTLDFFFPTGPHPNSYGTVEASVASPTTVDFLVSMLNPTDPLDATFTGEITGVLLLIVCHLSR